MTNKEAFWTIHEDLPRQGPGSDATTQSLLDVANASHGLKRAIDMGCGPGRASLLLAATGLEVVSIDTHEPFLNQLRASATEERLADKIEIQNMSMDNLSYPDASFDLIWAEGTAYIIGLEKALKEWKRLLKPHGKVVFTDCFWLTDKRSPDAIEFWKADPLMMTVEQASELATSLGYLVDYTYVQPDSDWFDEYYNPLTEKITTLKDNSDENMQKALEMTRVEIDVRKNHGTEYGHVGFVLST